MPHIILEHNLEDDRLVNRVCKKLHSALSKQDSVKLGSIKTRSLPVKDFIFADNSIQIDFAHVCLKLLSGRSDELKKTMSEVLFEVLSTEMPSGTLSVEVQELESYSKN